MILQAELPDQFFHAEFVVRGDTFKNARECAGFDRVMVWHDLVIFTALLGGHTHMRSPLRQTNGVAAKQTGSGR